MILDELAMGLVSIILRKKQELINSGKTNAEAEEIANELSSKLIPLYIKLDSESYDEKLTITNCKNILKLMPDDIDVLSRKYSLTCESEDAFLKKLLALESKYEPEFLKRNKIDGDIFQIEEKNLYEDYGNRDFIRLLGQIAHLYFIIGETESSLKYNELVEKIAPALFNQISFQLSLSYLALNNEGALKKLLNKYPNQRRIKLASSFASYFNDHDFTKLIKNLNSFNKFLPVALGDGFSVSDDIFAQCLQENEYRLGSAVEALRIMVDLASIRKGEFLKEIQSSFTGNPLVPNIFDVINEKNLLLFHYFIAINNGKSVPTFTYNDLKKICLKDSKDTSEIQEETKQFEKFESEKELKKAFDYLKSLGFFFKVEKGEYMTDLTFDIVFETIVEIVKQVQDDETDSIKTC